MKSALPRLCAVVVCVLPLAARSAEPQVEARVTSSGYKAMYYSGPGRGSEPLTLLGPTVSPYIAGRPEDVADIDRPSCRPSRLWRSPEEFLDAVAAAGLSSVRSFVHNPWLSGEPEPFLPSSTLESPKMSPELLRRLQSFGEACHRRGIVLQISLFDHISVRHASFGKPGQELRTPLMPWLRKEAGAQAADPRALCAAMFHFSGGNGGLSLLGRMQRLWIRSVVQVLPRGTVLYELINEPRWRNNPFLKREDLLAWQDWVIGQIREAERDFGLLRHGISISPDPHGLREGADIVLEDLLVWRELEAKGRLAHFRDVDLVVLHGQPFFGTSAEPQKLHRDLFRSMVPFLEQFPELAWELSSDGLNGRQHWAPETACVGESRSLSQVRHGFYTLPALAGRLEGAYPFVWTQTVQALSARWGAGRLHFNNWSPAAPAMLQLGQAKLEAAHRP